MGKNFKFGAKKDWKRKQRMKLHHKKKKLKTVNIANENVFEWAGPDEEKSSRNIETFSCNIESTMRNDGSNASDFDEMDSIEQRREHTTQNSETFSCNIENTMRDDGSNGSDSDEMDSIEQRREHSTQNSETFSCNIENTMRDDGSNANDSHEMDSIEERWEHSAQHSETFSCNIENTIRDHGSNASYSDEMDWISQRPEQSTRNSETFNSGNIDRQNQDTAEVRGDVESANVSASLTNSSDRNSEVFQNDETEDADNDGNFYGCCDVAAETRIDGRRIVEMNYFLKQLNDVADHNYGECLFRDSEVTKEIKNGLQSKLIFGCNNCGKKFTVLTNENEKTTETLGINSSAVLASNMVGIGYSQLEQFTSILDIPTMCADRFKSLNDDIGALWEITSEQSMKEAAEEERQAAIDRGDIDEEDGIPFISVVTDGCWCKRSYNKNYNALSGVAAIVGATFGKVLWIGVRNKYCVICVRNKNKDRTPPPHFCTCNYSGPSTEMEWQSIVQGFERSVEMYNIRFMKVIADGDSSTYLKILEAKPYQHRIVEKDECCNHLLRNFRKQLESATTGCPRGLTKHVVNSLERIRKGIACAVKIRNDEEIDDNEKITLLKSDIGNVIHHVFGDHVNCPTYIKEKCKEEEENHIPALKRSGTYEKLSVPLRKLMYCAKDLLLGQSNNIAEHYNSIVAKFVGGKRVNFALSNSFTYKAHAAAVQFNSKKAVTALYQTAFEKDPPRLTQKIEMKRLQKAVYGKERRTKMKENHIRPKRFNDTKEKGSGYGYGENRQDTDMAAENFENEKEIIIGKLKDYQENRNANEEKTRTKDNDLFRKITSIVLMASNFGSVCKAKIMSNQVKNICKKMLCHNKAARHNNESQPVAKQQLAKEQQISIRDCGIYIDKEHMCLAASPTGITNDGEMIIEIQCSTKIASKDPTDPTVLSQLPYMGKNKQGKLELKKSDDLYYQIQGQLHILEKNVCMFAVWTSSLHNMYVERIERDEDFFNSKMKTRLITFYNNWLLPEFADPRLKRNMAVREPGASGEPEL